MLFKQVTKLHSLIPVVAFISSRCALDKIRLGIVECRSVRADSHKHHSHLASSVRLGYYFTSSLSPRVPDMPPRYKMLRQLLAWCRNPPHSLTSSLMRSSQSQRSLSWQRHFFSRSGIPRHGPRTNQYRHNGNRKRQLHASLHTTIYVSITALILNEELDWAERRSLAIETIQNITGEEDLREKWRKFYETGVSLLAAYSGADLEYHEGAIRVPAGLGCFETRLFTTPDPEVEGGTLVLCLAAVRGAGGDTYFAENGNRLTDITVAIVPDVEVFASSLEASPRVRGAMVLLDRKSVV